MKKKGIIIGVIVLVLLLVAGGVCFYLKNKDDDRKSSTSKTEKITITFDADGGVSVEDVTFKKGTSVKLPTTTKEGYIFAGWFNGSEEVTAADTANLKKNIVLTAKWEEKTPDKKYIKITYDSKGGSKVKADEFECVNDSYTIESFPKNPTKDGYTFRAWEDKHGKVILTGAKLTCENITLYAAWDKKETKVSYKCTEGDLKGDKCVLTMTATYSCPEGTKADGDKCLKVTDKENGTRTCPTISIEGHDYVGTKVEAGTTFCYYAPVTTYTTKESCEAIPNGLSIDSDGHYDWRGEKCYKAALTNYKTTCSTGYVYYTKDAIQSLGVHDGGGCYRNYEKTASCDTGYTYDGKYCTKTVDATKVE